MSQNPALNLGTQSSKTPALKPVLAAALASLEVQLDEELARYRRTRTGYRTPCQTRTTSYTSSQPQQFTAISTTTGKKPTAAPTSLAPEEQFVQQTKPNTPPATVPETPQEMPALKTANTEDLPNVKVQAPPEVVAKTQTTPSSPNTSIVPAVVKQEKTETTPPDDTRTQPEGYWESSEALLRSLTEEQPQKRKPTNSDLLSPLGIGSMLLLLVSSLTLGYLLFNPKSLSVFSFGGTSQPNSPSTSSTNTEGTKPDSPTTPIPKHPNLATAEFPEVKDPNDVVGLKPKAKPTPIASPSPAAQKPLSEIKLSADGFYHVVIDNQGESAFASARQVVPDAYLSPDGKLIYLGAFKSKEEVKEQMQLLQDKKINARVQQP